MPVIDPSSLGNEHFDLVIVGSGFGSAFYLHKLLEQDRLRKILVVEWGEHHPHAWQIEQDRNSALDHQSTYSSNSDKPWRFTIGLGGGTNCWYAQTPRFHPSDFELRTHYGIGQDWPMSYADLEPYYAEAEAIMSVSGDPDMARIMPRSTDFPQPPHRMTAADRVMKQAQPQHHFAMPTARARVATANRSSCCASFRCDRCPVDAKFTLNNGLLHLFDHPSVSLALQSEAISFDGASGSISALTFRHQGKDVRVSADRFILGANAIHSPAILLRSGMDGALVGKGLHESYGCNVEVFLDGLDNLDGSTITTGLNFGLYDGDFRSEYGAALVYFENRFPHGLRPEPGRWRQILPLMIVVEDLLEDENRVVIDARGNAHIQYKGPAEYAVKGRSRALEKLPDLLAPLPVEKIEFRSHRPTESHLQGTLRMGSDRQNSVIDGDQIHHRWRNLTIVGSSAFTTCSSANPSLTVAALSLRAADRAGRA